MQSKYIAYSLVPLISWVINSHTFFCFHHGHCWNRYVLLIMVGLIGMLRYIVPEEKSKNNKLSKACAINGDKLKVANDFTYPTFWVVRYMFKREVKVYALKFLKHVRYKHLPLLATIKSLRPHYIKKKSTS